MSTHAVGDEMETIADHSPDWLAAVPFTKAHAEMLERIDATLTQLGAMVQQISQNPAELMAMLMGGGR